MPRKHLHPANLHDGGYHYRGYSPGDLRRLLDPTPKPPRWKRLLAWVRRMLNALSPFTD